MRQQSMLVLMLGAWRCAEDVSLGRRHYHASQTKVEGAACAVPGWESVERFCGESFPMNLESEEAATLI